MGMGKTRVRTTSSIQKAWITNFEQKSARGDYEPFYRTQDITSSGIKGRIPCPINPGLVYHTLSLNETFTLIQLLHDPLVVDIKEQYPELDVKKSKAFAEALGIKHPRHVWSSTESVITWDFLVELKFGPKRAISVKPEYLLKDRRTVEKLKLEKALAESLGYEHIVVTDKQVKTEEVKNIFRILRGANLPSDLKRIYSTWFQHFRALVRESFYRPLSETVESLACDNHLSYVDSFTLMQHAFWVWDITSDPTVPLYPEYSPYVLGVEIHA
ncbi:TnsA endonuclease N-terminal domain-containing protein [Rheinheimera sp. 1928-s]|uniref:TnsA endonuclease N-terminal domain-containing protein n=1 Tax=Rheinheimera sp. 1928-s TaxID=3033803 RepID=UPI00262BB021|nr:TnsA endonuclease N-terminal domain-containing protein [Rheinheimera sp. 1928-s]MDF3123493.1 TnsA endonuclease N-terminal domain-containing protein [Rheinheimera sp. 1928-s]